ncbi:peptidoglycan-binding domain-containing protein [Funiculus sociatus]|uniref:peptidoglycan-binding domain-containing protein n=1 Tax=Funiculus sociatus TaxID=450527 RepID=UPI00329947F2
MKKLFLLPFAFLLLPFAFNNLPSFAQATPTAINRPNLKTGSQGGEVSELQAVLRLLGYYTGEVNGVYGDSTAIAVSRFQQAAGLKPDGVVGAETWRRLFPTSPPSATVAATTPAPTPAPTSTTGAASFPVPTTTTAAATPTPAATPRPAVRVPQRQTTPTRTTRTTRTPNRQPTPRPTPQARVSQATRSATDFPILRVGMQGPAVTTLQQRLRTLGFYRRAVNGLFDASTQAAVIAAQQRFKLTADGVVGPATWSALLR